MFFLPKSRNAWLVAVAFVATLVVATSCNSGGKGTGVPTGPGAGLELNSGTLVPNATYTHRFAAADDTLAGRTTT